MFKELSGLLNGQLGRREVCALLLLVLPYHPLKQSGMEEGRCVIKLFALELLGGLFEHSRRKQGQKKGILC